MRRVVLTAVLMSGIITAQAVTFSTATTQGLCGTAIVWDDDEHYHHDKKPDKKDNMPEPGTLALLVAGLLGTIAFARKAHNQ
jgi:hypothetical protein